MPSEQFTIRRATPDDADALAHCIDAAYARYQGQITDLPPVSEGCAEEITTNQVWVVECDGAIIGCLVLAIFGDVLKLANLAVHPEHGGQGIGRKLIELGVSEARAQGYGELHLNTHAKMTDNIELYQKLGWVETARQGNTVSMRKRI
ncbi:MAG: GNAT family N-acetyltransferase [Thalassospira sp.]|uniref:GNAT family N-acetyltransferase n=1 Tax=Thalassospira sp. TaxID=1912094 RepID=UPI003A8702F7